MNDPESSKEINQYLSNDEFDLNDIINFFIRNFKSISICTFFLALISSFFSLIIKPTWEGEFQIVLNSKEKDQIGISGVGKRFLSGLNNKKNDINTEVEILKSPSVMKPVFIFAKKLIQEEQKNEVKLSYKKWIESKLDIELLEDTYVLSIKYQDQNKDSILPILNLISSQYQGYSGRKRNLGIENSINYVDLQISQKKAETKKSLIALQKFSIDNNLGGFDGMIPMQNNIIDDGMIQNNGNSNVTGRYKEHFRLLSKLEAELIEKSSFYKSNSETIKTLERKIISLEESLKRPQEILLKHRELSRQAQIDELSLTNLEKQKTILKIEQLKEAQPWELITNPFLNEIQIAPKKKEIVLFYSIIGLILGISYSFFKEKRSDIIFSLSRLKKIIPFKMLKTLEYKDSSFALKELEIISLSCFKEKGTYNLITFDEENKNVYEDLLDKLSSKGKEIKICYFNKTFKIDNKDINYLLIKKGSIKTVQISSFIENLNLMNIDIKGWFNIQ